MKRIVHALVACALVLFAAPARPAHAATPPVTFVFEAVDSIELVYDRDMFITGLVQGESQPREVQFRVVGDMERERCDKAVLLAISKPGRYLLQIGGSGRFDIYSCKLIRR